MSLCVEVIVLFCKLPEFVDIFVLVLSCSSAYVSSLGAFSFGLMYHSSTEKDTCLSGPPLLQPLLPLCPFLLTLALSLSFTVPGVQAAFHPQKSFPRLGSLELA